MFRHLAAVALVASLAGCATNVNPQIPVPTQSNSVVPSAVPTTKPTPEFDPTVFSIEDPESIWVVVNKRRPLEPANYVPKDLVTLKHPHRADPRLRSGAASAYTAMYKAAKADGIKLVILSAYRSYNLQIAVHGGLVQRMGQERADLQAARPGHSEHQLGLAVDIAAANGRCTIDECFEDTPEGRWLTENAWKFGWVLRYPKGLTAVTGYIYEPWHWRYVGRGLAAELQKSPNITLEEFYGLPPATDYAN